MTARSGWLQGHLAWRPRTAATTDAEREVFTLGEWSVRAFDVRPRHPLAIECIAGELLVTCEGDPEDHIVAAGESLEVHRRGRVVVAALAPSRVGVRAPKRGQPGSLRRAA
jgi:hypothetical protein